MWESWAIHPPLSDRRIGQGDQFKFRMNKAEKQQVNNRVIRKIRESLGINQKDFAKMLGTDNSRLSKIERGEHTPEWLLKFALLSRLLHESGMTWEDVVMELPELRVSEDGGEYRSD